MDFLGSGEDSDFTLSNMQDFKKSRDRSDLSF